MEETPSSSRAEHSADGEPLDRLFRYHRERLKRLVTFRLDPVLKRRLDESDIIQDAFVEACRKYEAYQRDPSVPVFIWLRLIVTETLIDTQRHHLGVQGRDPRRESYERSSPTGQTSVLSLANQLVDDLTPPHISMARKRRSLDCNAFLRGSIR